MIDTLRMYRHRYVDDVDRLTDRQKIYRTALINANLEVMGLPELAHYYHGVRLILSAR